MPPLFENILTVLQRWQLHYLKHLKVDGDGIEDEEEDVDKDDNKYDADDINDDISTTMIRMMCHRYH